MNNQQGHHDIEEAPRRRGHPLDEHTIGNNSSTLEDQQQPAILPLQSTPQSQPAPTGNKRDVPPQSRGLPLTISKRHGPGSQGTPEADLKLIHPILNRIPLHIRFGFNGILTNLLFMYVYNTAVTHFHSVSSSTIYSILYLFFIPLGHATVSLLVFGWPERYIPSLMSNFPIGLTAIAIGGALTAYLDRIEFESRIEDFIRDNFTFSHMPARADEEQSEFYSSIVVLVVTSIWTYVLSIYINSPPAKSDKKEL